MVKLELLWSTNPAWSHWEGWNQVLNDDAPEEAKRSYQRYLHQLADIDRRTERNRIIPKGQTGIDYYKKEEPLWEAGYYDPDLLTVFSIPYDEFCRVRGGISFAEYMEERGSVLHEDGVRELLELMKDIDAPEIKGVLSEVLEWHSYVEYCAQHII